MKKFYFLLLVGFLLFSVGLFAQTDGGVSIGKGNVLAHDKAILELVSQTKGLLIPRMTSAQRLSIFSAADESAKGLLVYDNDQATLFSWDGSKWSALMSTANLKFSVQGGNLVLTDSNGKSVNIALADLQTGTTSVASTPPAGPAIGATYFNTTDQKMYVYNATSWTPVGNQMVVEDLLTSTSSSNALSAKQGKVLNDAITARIAKVDGFAGDVTGVYNSIIVNKIQGVPVSSTAPATNQVLKFNGTSWMPAYEVNTNTDSQSLSVSGNTLSISGGNSVTLPAGGGSGTDSQTLTLSGSSLSISGGNAVDLSTISGSVPSGLTNPATGAVGDTFFNTSDNKLYVYNGTAWNPVGTDGSTPISAIVPPVGGAGNTYYNTNDNTYYVSNGTAWVPVSGGTSGTSSGLTNPATGAVGDTFFNTSDNKLYVYNGTAWNPVGTDGSTPTSSTIPAVGVAGSTYYNTSDNTYYVSDGTAWVPVDTNTDSQSLSVSGNTLSISGGNSVTLPAGGSSVPSGLTNPATGAVGDTFFNTSDNKLYVYNGTAWNPVGTDGSTPISAIVPPVGGAGNTYYNTNDNTYYVSNGTAWVPVSGGTSGTSSGLTNPATGAVGDTFFNTSDNKLYVYNGTAWNPVGTDGSTPISAIVLPVGGAGNTYYNTSDNTYYVSDGTAWVPVDTNTDAQSLSISGTTLTISGGNSVTLPAGGSSVPSGLTNPATGAVGDTFFNTSDNKLYVYNGTAWNPVGTDGSTPISAIVPPVGGAGNTYYNTSDNTYYVSDGTAWIPVDTDDQTATEVVVTPNATIGLSSSNVQAALEELQGEIATAAAGGMTSVVHDGSLSGNGIAGNELGVSDNGITETKIAANAVTTGKIADDAVTAAKIAADVAGTGLKQNVTTGALEVDAATVTGDGTITSTDLTVTGGDNAAFNNVTLDIKDGAVTAAKLNAMGATDGQVLKYNTTTSVWEPATAIVTTVEDNLTSTSGANALSANQGKVLNDALTTETNRATTAEGTKIAKADAFAGDVTGTYDATVIGNNAVTSAKISDDAVTACQNRS